MIKELFNAIAAALKEVDDGIIQHIDMWNQNVEFIEEDEAWSRPAVFIEFGEIVWDPYKGPVNGMTGKGEVFLHIVTDWKGSAAEGSPCQKITMADFDLPNRICEKLRGLSGITFRNLMLSRTLTNHNHQELLENIDVYKVTYERIL